MRRAAGGSRPGPGLPEDAARPGGQAAGPAQAEHGEPLARLILAESQRVGLSAGSRLPTERQLAMDLGVTRSSVRHALGLLEAQGRISREVGRGTFLREPPQLAAVPAQSAGGTARPGEAGPAGVPVSAGSDFAPADVMTVRRLLEPPAMSLVVAWATATDLEDMNRCLEGGDRAGSYEEFEDWDLALHRCIMRASRSPLLITLYAAIEQARHGHVWGDLKRRSSSADHRQQYQQDHRAIVAALRTRDSARAVEAMRLHLARVSDHLHASDPAAVVTWQ